MSISQPSTLTYVLDVARITDFAAAFTYNFFTPDECTNDSGGVPAEALTRPAGTIDASFVQWSVTRVPREVTFTWTAPRIASVGNTVSAQEQRANRSLASPSQYGSLIRDNLDKVVDEDYFAAGGMTAINFYDGEIDDRVHALVSGALLIQSLDGEQPNDVSHNRAAQNLSTAMPDGVTPQFLSKALSQPQQAFGAQFSTTVPRTASPTKNPKSPPPPYADTFYDGLKKVAVAAQVNTKLLLDLVGKAVSDPTSPGAADLVQLHQYSQAAQQSLNQRMHPGISEDDFKTFVPYVGVKKSPTSAHHEKYATEVVGYIIDKIEVLADGTTALKTPIVIDNPNASLTADFSVKFHTNYAYAIRTVALLTIPAIDDGSGDVATIQVLVSSRPSNTVYVSTTKLVPPPPPGDLTFVWDYSQDRLMLTWSFPVWSQRDVAQFQVFRRSSVDRAFELQRVYDFDTSEVRFPSADRPDPSLVESLTSPCTYYVDPSFDWNVNTSQARGLIYSVACLDSHGLSSSLSAQYRVWFDRFKNQLQVEHVSHLGAPKHYPNLYLDGDMFVDTVRVSGPHSRTLKLYFNPDYYHLYDSNGKVEHAFATAQRGGSYKVQLLNLDNAQSQVVDVTIDDRTGVDSRKLAQPQFVLGPRVMNSAILRTSG